MKRSVPLVVNTNYKEDRIYVLKLFRYAMISIAAWPCEKRLFKFLSRIVNVIQGSIMLICCLTMGFEIIFNQKSMVLLIAYITNLNTYVCLWLKYVIQVMQTKCIKLSIQQVEMDWKHMLAGTKDVMMRKVKTARLLLITSFSIGIFTVCSWHVSNFTKGVEIVDNVTHYNLYYPAHFLFFDASTSPYYYYIYLLQSISEIFSCLSLVNSFTSVSFILHACGQYEILYSFINDVNISASFDDVHSQLKFAIRKHCQLIRFISNIDKSWCWVYYSDWWSCMTGFFLGSYLFIKEPGTINSLIKNACLIITLSYTFLILCYIGDGLTEMSRSLRQAAYNCPWYELPKQYVDMLFMIQNISYFPDKLTAGKILVLSLGTFSNVLKTVLAFYNLLKSTL